MNALQLAQRLTALRDQLGDLAARARQGYLLLPAAPVAASYLRLLDRLAGIDGEAAGAIAAAVADAIEVYDAASSYAEQAEQARRQRQAAEREKAARRHQIALVIGCATCDAVAGQDCHTLSPAQRPKGMEVHAGRYRMAAGMHGQAGEEPGGGGQPGVP